MSMNTKFFAGIIIFGVQCISAMEDQKLTTIKEMIKTQKLSGFFACIETMNCSEFVQYKKTIKELIESTKLKTIGIDPRIGHPTKISQVQKVWSKPFDVMSDGMDCIEQDLNDKQIQEEFDSLISKN